MARASDFSAAARTFADPGAPPTFWITASRLGGPWLQDRHACAPVTARSLIACPSASLFGPTSIRVRAAAARDSSGSRFAATLRSDSISRLSVSGSTSALGGVTGTFGIGHGSGSKRCMLRISIVPPLAPARRVPEATQGVFVGARGNGAAPLHRPSSAA